jgi:hypothetical protein
MVGIVAKVVNLRKYQVSNVKFCTCLLVWCYAPRKVKIVMGGECNILIFNPPI